MEEQEELVLLMSSTVLAIAPWMLPLCPPSMGFSPNGPPFHAHQASKTNS